MKISKWLGIYSKINSRSGGYDGTLIWVPPVYPQGSARLAVGFVINLSKPTKLTSTKYQSNTLNQKWSASKNV